MRKKLLTTGLVLVSFLNMYAGGLLTNTNQNVSFLRNPARGASIEIDAAYTNPAGLAFLKKEGFYLSLNNQSAFQTRTITADFAPFAGFGGSAVKEFKGKAEALSIPNIQAAYKKGDNWVFSANIGVVGGGGTLTFDKGLPSFEAPVSMIPAYINQVGAGLPALMPGATLTANQYSLDAFFEGSSMILGAQLGASYLINEVFSAYLGGRVNIVNNGYKGHLKNIMTNPASNIPGFGSGTMISAGDYFSGLTQVSGLPDNIKSTLTDLANGAADKNLDCKQSGTGITPIIGLHYQWEELNIGVRYEFQTKLDIKNETKVDGTGLFKDGAKTPYDIPALLSAGISYDITPELIISGGYHHFFDSNAKMANDKQKFINGGINEFLGGIEYHINDKILVSCGGQITRTGVTDTYQSDMSFSLNSYSIGFGGAINLTHKIRLNLAYLFTNYEDWTKSSDNYVAGTGVKGTDIFGRTNKSFGIGLDFRF